MAHERNIMNRSKISVNMNICDLLPQDFSIFLILRDGEKKMEIKIPYYLSIWKKRKDALGARLENLKLVFNVTSCPL